MMKIILLLIPFSSFGQFTIERVAYDPAGTNDTLWTRDGSNKDTLFRRVGGNYVFGCKPYFRRFWTTADLPDWAAIIGNINTTIGLKANQTDVTNSLALKANQATPLFANPLGYTTGAGGTVTQATSKSTGVTLNKVSGRITMSNAALAAGAEVAFTLTNSFIAATDVVLVNMQSVGTANAYLVSVGAVSAGSCSITVSNASAGSLSQAVVLNFVIIKSSIN